MEMKKEESARDVMFFGLMAKIDHNFLLNFENSALYFRSSDFWPTVIQSVH